MKLNYFTTMPFFLLMLLGCSKNHLTITKTDLDKQDLYGKIKSLEEKTYEISHEFGAHRKNKVTFWVKTIYDVKGFKLEELTFCPDGRYLGKCEYKYENGCLSEFVVYNSEKKLSYTGKYSYDKSGNNIEVKLFISTIRIIISQKEIYTLPTVI